MKREQVVQYEKDSYNLCFFGEMKNKELHGRGICIYPNGGGIRIGYFHNRNDAPGNYIHICWDGTFIVGEGYLKDGRLRRRGTSYYSDGTILSSDYDAPALGSFENLNTEFDDYKDNLVLEDTEEEDLVLEDMEEEEVKTSHLNLNATPSNPKTSSFAQGGWQQQTSNLNNSKQNRCIFFNTKQGCRYGEQCRFYHG